MLLRNWWLLVLIEDWQHGGFGLYLHWPFCEAKCPYCDFNSYVSKSIDHDAWIKAFDLEIQRYGKLFPDRILKSIYFGGGTPSLMKPDGVGALLDRISSQWKFANDIEITLEANPSSIEIQKFQDFKTAGINRVSIGVQALDDKALRALGRLHSHSEALKAVEIGRTVFDRVSFDLIYARQHQTLAEWDAELQQALSFDPDHLSLYQLTIEPETAFGARQRLGTLKGLPDEDLGADMYDLTQHRTQSAGLPSYEVSNHAKIGHESRHNQIYWQGGDFIGIGPGAHGRITKDNTRYSSTTPLSPNIWLESALQQNSSQEIVSSLSKRDVYNELLMMGLRMNIGVAVNRTEAITGHPFVMPDELVEYELVTVDDGMIRTTDKGRPVLNYVIEKLLI